MSTINQEASIRPPRNWNQGKATVQPRRPVSPSIRPPGIGIKAKLFVCMMRWRRTLCELGQRVANLEREIFRAGFELLHPTAGSCIMARLCAEGRAERVERARGSDAPLLRG